MNETSTVTEPTPAPLPFASVLEVRRVDRREVNDPTICEEGIARGVPLVIAGGVPDSLRRWDFSFLRREIGRARVECWVSPSGRVLCGNNGDLDDLYAEADRSLDVGRYYTFLSCVDEVIDRILAPHTHAPIVCEGERIYLHGGRIPKVLEPDLVAAPYMPPPVTLGPLWLSQAGAVTTMHWDSRPGFLAQTEGIKRVVMVPSHLDMRGFPRHDRRWRQSRFTDLSRIDVDDGGDISRAVCWVTQLGPGDVLLIPPLVWHEVTTVHHSVSVTFGVERKEIADAILGIDALFGASGPFARIPRCTARGLLSRLFRVYKVRDRVFPEEKP